MTFFPAVLGVAAVVALLTGDRRFLTDRAPVRFKWLFAVAAMFALLPFVVPNSWPAASGIGRACTIGAFAVLGVGFLINVRTSGMALMLMGATLNLLVISANAGRMPLEEGASRRAGVLRYYERLSDPGPQRHEQVDGTTRLRLLDDRIPLSSLRAVISFGDVVLAAGAAWWLLAAMGSRLVPRRAAVDVAAPTAAR